MSAVVGALAIAASCACRGAAPSSHATSSVLVAAPPTDAGLVVEPSKDDDAQSVQYGSLRAVDWRNFDYGDLAAQLRDGEAEGRTYQRGADAWDRVRYRFVGVAFGELDEEKGEEAAILVRRVETLADGRREEMGSIYVYRLVGGRPELLYADRFVGLGTAVRTKGQRILIDRRDDGRECVLEIDCHVDRRFDYTITCPP